VDVKTTLLSVDERINGIKKHSPAIIHTKMNVKLYSCYSLFVIRGVSKKCKLRVIKLLAIPHLALSNALSQLSL